MKKRLLSEKILLLLLAVCVGLLFSAAFTREEVLFASASAAEKPLRLHILANSDSPEDQQLKLALRDHILLLTEDMLADAEDKQAAMDILSEKTAWLTAECDRFLAANGVDYTAELRLEQADFPEIAYDDAVFAAGRYDSLRILLGEAQGHNWWCVLFPPLCFLDAAGGYADTDALSLLSAYGEYAEAAAHTEIRWKLKEWWTDQR